MATVTRSKLADGVVQAFTGSYTGDGTAVTISIGFNPLWALVVNETDVITYEKIDPMVAANTIKTIAAGTMTLDTGSAVVFNGDRTVTISAAAGASGKAMKFIFKG